VQVKIPYETGMNPYSGLTDMFDGKELLKKEGNSLVYTTAAGEVIKKFRKGWERNDDGCLDVVMADFMANPHQKAPMINEEVIEEVPAEIVEKPKKSKKEEVAEWQLMLMY